MKKETKETVGFAAGATTGTIAAVTGGGTAISLSGSVTGLSGAGIMSGLAFCGLPVMCGIAIISAASAGLALGGAHFGKKIAKSKIFS